jgi:hypothetical protein
MLVLVIDLSSLSWWGAGAHPHGAHKAAGNKAEAVNLAEDKSHQLWHEFLHPLFFLHHLHVVVSSSVQLVCFYWSQNN